MLIYAYTYRLMYVSIYIPKCLHYVTYIHTHTYMCTYVHICISIYVCSMCTMDRHVFLHVCNMCMYVFTYMHICLHTYVDIYIHMYV